MEEIFDVAVIGGGINGCGIAADAALRGLSTCLIEQSDIASKTSSSSSKLIHGGLRYLEYYHFALVKKALDERQTLLKIAPHLVSPLPFVIPDRSQMRSSLWIRAGLWLYDHLSFRNNLPKSKTLSRTQYEEIFSPLQDSCQKGFLFYDCITDDARLTLANALQAKAYGAKLLLHTTVIKGEQRQGQWLVQTASQNGSVSNIYAKTVINATGPWAMQVNYLLGVEHPYTLSYVKGSHIVVPKFYEGTHAYLLQNEDKRIIFVIPFHGFILIGTTDVPINNCSYPVSISSAEMTYLLDSIHRYFKCSLQEKDIVANWSGIRPLLAQKDISPSALSRDYVFHYEKKPAPIVTIYGGKITTYRQLSMDVVDCLADFFPKLPASQTATTPLPGYYDEQTKIKYEHAFSWLDADLFHRLLKTYGSKMAALLAGCHSYSDLGIHFGHGLYQREIDYLITEEWADSSEAILWRRTKLGLVFNQDERERLELFCKERLLGRNDSTYCR